MLAMELQTFFMKMIVCSMFQFIDMIMVHFIQDKLEHQLLLVKGKELVIISIMDSILMIVILYLTLITYLLVKVFYSPLLSNLVQRQLLCLVDLILHKVILWEVSGLPQLGMHG